MQYSCTAVHRLIILVVASMMMMIIILIMHNLNCWSPVSLNTNMNPEDEMIIIREHEPG